MKKRKKNYILSEDELKLLHDNATQYSVLLDYVKQKIHTVELITTNQIVAQYHVTRQTIYRISKSGLLKPIFKYRAYYFDIKDVEKFFEQYRRLKE